MTTVLEDEVLEKAAEDGSMDYNEWPALIEQVLQRLDHIVHNEFPMPMISSPESTQPIQPTIEETPQSISTDRLPESSQPTDTQATESNFIDQALDSSPPRSHSVIPNSQPTEITAPSGTLPPDLLSFYSGITSALKSSFLKVPPFTIQRLSELILRPRAHYRTLPSYLRAIDRIVCVSSTADTFPLPSLSEDDGESNSYLTSSGVVSNDDFNGAALTRIPWLKDSGSMGMSSERPLGSDLRTESTSMIEGPNGTGSIETVTVSVNGFPSTIPADIPPASAAEQDGMEEDETHDADEADANSSGRGDEEADTEPVHVRGPDEIGMQDMGPQALRPGGHIFDAEAALGRPGESEQGLSPRPQEARDEFDADGDAVVEDAEEQVAEKPEERPTEAPEA